MTAFSLVLQHASCFVAGEVPPDTTSSYSSGDLEVQQATDDMIDDNIFPPPPPSVSSCIGRW